MRIPFLHAPNDLGCRSGWVSVCRSSDPAPWAQLFPRNCRVDPSSGDRVPQILVEDLTAASSMSARRELRCRAGTATARALGRLRRTRPNHPLLRTRPASVEESEPCACTNIFLTLFGLGQCSQYTVFRIRRGWSRTSLTSGTPKDTRPCHPLASPTSRAISWPLTP